MSGSTAVVTRWTFGNAYATLWTPTTHHQQLSQCIKLLHCKGNSTINLMRNLPPAHQRVCGDIRPMVDFPTAHHRCPMTVSNGLLDDRLARVWSDWSCYVRMHTVHWKSNPRPLDNLVGHPNREAQHQHSKAVSDWGATNKGLEEHYKLCCGNQCLSSISD